MLLNGRATLLVLLFATVSSAASLVGFVYSEEGRPVDGVLVTVQSTKMTPSGLPRQQAVTDVQGRLNVLVADGEYSVCVSSDYKGLLSSCEWNLSESIVKVAAPLTQFKIILKRGVTLRIRLNDPARLASRLVPNTDASVTFIVWDAIGHSHYVREVGGDDKGTNLELLVPANVSLRLSAQTRNVDVIDTAGKSASKASVGLVSRISDLGDTRVYQVVPANVDVKGSPK